MKKKYMIILGLCFILIYGYSYYTNYQYEKIIGSHMMNARDMNTPSRMLDELNLAKHGMVEEGLTKDMNGALFFKKPSNSMDFQYEHIDSIIERVKAVDVWYNKVYKSETGQQAETLGDVYEQKMDNLRDFIMEDTRSDLIAHNTWLIQHNIPVYLVGRNVGISVNGVGLFPSNLMMILLMGLGLKYYTDRHGKDKGKPKDKNKYE